MVFDRFLQWVIRISLVFAVILFGFGIVFYSRLPAKIPIQFGLDGSINTWGSKNTVFLFPAILMGVTLTGRSNYVDIKYPTYGEARIRKFALCGCLLLIWGVGAYIFFVYAKLLQ